MKHRGTFLGVTLIALATVGAGACSSDDSSGGSDDAGAAGGATGQANHPCDACDHTAHSIPEESFCQTFIGSTWDVAVRRQRCGAVERGLCSDSCPAANKVGVCEIGAGTKDEWSITYYSDKWKKADAQAECEGRVSATFK